MFLLLPLLGILEHQIVEIGVSEGSKDRAQQWFTLGPHCGTLDTSAVVAVVGSGVHVLIVYP